MGPDGVARLGHLTPGGEFAPRITPTFRRWRDPSALSCNRLRATAAMTATGTRVAECNATMRERTPRSGFGFALTMIVFITATILILSNILEKFPRR
jgi:hypothetical protein